MRKKFLHVALIVALMAVICCVSAFAEMPYPDGLPAPPSDVEGFSFLIRLRNDVYSLLYTDSPQAVLYSSGSVNGFPELNSGSFSYGKYDLNNGSWVLSTPFGEETSIIYLASDTNFVYSNFNIYDSEGNLVFDGAPAPPDPYENFWSDLKEVGTGVLDWAGNVASTITAEPVLLFTVGIFILGAAIGIFRRLLVRG